MNSTKLDRFQLISLLLICCGLLFHVDVALKISFASYDIKAVHLFWLVLVALAATHRGVLADFQRAWKPYIPLLAFLASGLSTVLIYRFNLPKGLAYWVWVSGTSLTVTFFIPRFARERQWFLPFLAAVGCGLGIVILWDAFSCLRGAPGFAIGHPTDPHGVCRARAWSQEPGYFVGILIPLFILFLFLAEAGKLRLKPWLYAIAVSIFTASILLTTSRLAFITMPVILLLSAATLKRMRYTLWITLAAMVLISFWGLSIIDKSDLNAKKGIGGLYSLKYVTNSFRTKFDMDFSLWDRLKSFGVAREINKEYPLFGVGPGAGMAAAQKIRGEGLELDPHVPLSQETYSEIMTEWGWIGGSLLAAFFVLWLWNFAMPPLRLAPLLLSAIAVQLASSQTLPRFQLWFLTTCLCVAASLARKPSAEKSRVENTAPEMSASN